MILIDGDVLLYKAGFSAETKEADEEGNPIKVAAPLWVAKANLDAVINKILKELKDEYLVVLSAHKEINYRFEVATTLPYKGNRKEEDKPIHYAELKKHLEARHPCVVTTYGEGDDLMGYLQCTMEVPTILVSIDKDMLMIPGINYNMNTGQVLECSDPGDLWVMETRAGTKILKGHGFKWFCAQMLMGDKVDNIPGLHRYGPVKALTNLKDCTTIRDMWAKVLRLYRKEGHRKDRIQEVRQLLWIQRDKPFQEYLKK
jgi:5'-3' exonuclease